jgi:hypothetical protein
MRSNLLAFVRVENICTHTKQLLVNCPVLCGSCNETTLQASTSTYYTPSTTSTATTTTVDQSCDYRPWNSATCNGYPMLNDECSNCSGSDVIMWRAGVNAKAKDASSEHDGQIRSSPLVGLPMSVQSHPIAAAMLCAEFNVLSCFCGARNCGGKRHSSVVLLRVHTCACRLKGKPGSREPRLPIAACKTFRYTQMALCT